jgi:hypothetical protein
LQRHPIDASFDAAAHRFDLGKHGLRSVAQVVHTGSFAAAAMLAIVERRDHDLLLLEYKSGNAKRRRQTQFLHLDAQFHRRH